MNGKCCSNKIRLVVPIDMHLNMCVKNSHHRSPHSIDLRPHDTNRFKTNGIYSNWTVLQNIFPQLWSRNRESDTNNVLLVHGDVSNVSQSYNNPANAVTPHLLHNIGRGSTPGCSHALPSCFATSLWLFHYWLQNNILLKFDVACNCLFSIARFIHVYFTQSLESKFRSRHAIIRLKFYIF